MEYLFDDIVYSLQKWLYNEANDKVHIIFCSMKKAGHKINTWISF